jgi:hypothetical protein
MYLLSVEKFRARDKLSDVKELIRVGSIVGSNFSSPSKKHLMKLNIILL